MRWTWPSWLAIGLGVLTLILAFTFYDWMVEFASFPMAMALGGFILIATGLHALQGAWTACCDYGGCDCDHCGSCAGGDCCGKCDCMGGHEHGNGAAHTH